METQTEDSRSNQIVKQRSDKSSNKWLLIAIAVLSTVLIAAILVASLPPKNPQANIQRAHRAEAARYTALAAYYTAKDGANRQRAILADAARYTGLAEFYLAEKDAVALLRASKADAARYAGLAEFYAEKDAAALLRAREADAARYAALAAYYMAKVEVNR